MTLGSEYQAAGQPAAALDTFGAALALSADLGAGVWSPLGLSLLLRMRAAAAACAATAAAAAPGTWAAGGGPRPKEALELSLRLLSRRHRQFLDPALRSAIFAEAMEQLASMVPSAAPSLASSEAAPPDGGTGGGAAAATVVRVGRTNGKELLAVSGSFGGRVSAEAATRVTFTVRFLFVHGSRNINCDPSMKVS